MTIQSLRDAIRESGAGNKEAFRAIFDQCYEKVFKYLLARARTRDDAADLAQESFIDLWQALPRFRYLSDGQFYGFLFTIAKRKLAKYYAGQTQTVELDEARITESFTLDVEDYRQLTRLIAQLPSKYQELLRLRYWGELSWKEVAVVLGCTENAAKVWHHRAIRKLQRIAKQQ